MPKLWRQLSPWLDALAIGGWGTLLLKLWLSGQLYLLIHPNYIWMTSLTGMVLLAIGLCEAWQTWRRQRPFATSHATLLRPGWSSGLLLLTALIGLAIQPRPFASDTAIHRGVNDTTLTTRSLPQSFRASNRPEARSLVEWVRTLNVYPEPDAYKGQKAKVQGFAVHPKELSEEYFLLTRFIITCCAADVYPVSLTVKVPNRRSYPPDKWFEVEGRMTTVELNGKRQLAIDAAKLTSIPEPKNPYDY